MLSLRYQDVKLLFTFVNCPITLRHSKIALGPGAERVERQFSHFKMFLSSDTCRKSQSVGLIRYKKVEEIRVKEGKKVEFHRAEVTGMCGI